MYKCDYHEHSGRYKFRDIFELKPISSRLFGEALATHRRPNEIRISKFIILPCKSNETVNSLVLGPIRLVEDQHRLVLHRCPIRLVEPFH